jgi:acyl transferase domain-containing protein/acyl carrier protein/NADP-dependent 3-hydroxy acid dehydrogenase YdfG
MHNKSSNVPLAIIGIGCLFPKAAGPGFFWANVKHGTDCIGDVPPTHWNPADYFDPDPKAPDMTYARRGGFLSAVEFNPLEFGIAPRDIEATDTTQLLGLVAAKQALVDARVTLKNPPPQPPSLKGGGSKTAADSPLPSGRGVGGVGSPVDRDRVSVILGVTGTLELVIPLGARLGHPKWKRAMRDAGVPAELADDAAARIAESYVPWQENSFPGLLGNVVAGRIANKLDLGGTNCVVDAACASSLSAVHLAALELQTGRCDVAVTGGCDTFNDIFMFMCFSKTPALSPTGDAKPFDADGDGTILGEGLGMVVLKRLADAERDGDTVYAVLKGVGSSSDGKGKAIYEPSSAGQKKALLAAYRAAGVTPDTIELVEAHGTGTKVGDTVEVTALNEVYGGLSPKARPWCAIGSVKSQIGHTKAAAGAASLIKAALALYNKVLPPTLKVARPVEPLRAPDSPFYVSTEMRPWLPRREHPRRAALSAFGFGGSNFHAVLEEHAPEKAEPDWDGSVEIVALGAGTPQALAAELAKLPTEWDAFARAAEASRGAFDARAACRLCFAAHRTRTDLPKLIAGAAAQLGADPNAGAWSTPDGAHYGRGPAPGGVAVLFPGQGSQYVGMLRELMCLFPEALGALALANEAVAELAQDDTDARRLSDHVFPPGTFDDERKKQYEHDLRDTRTAQPALGAVSFGAWRVLSERFGLTVDAFAGHSYGELVALAAAGHVRTRDLFTLSRVRGQLMASQREGDPGAMLAAFAAPAEIEPHLAREKLRVVVANKNAPKQTVLSGPTAHIERAARLLSDAGVRATRLPVAAAFHSVLVADAAVPFRAALEPVSLNGSSAVVFANTTAAAYPAEARAAKDLLANQLAKPVAFVEQVRAMAAAGVRTFVEVGPGSVLTRLVEAILTDAPVAGAAAFALDAGGGKRSGVLDLGGALARIAARGHAVALAEWERGGRCRPAPVPAGKRTPTVSVCGANSVTPRPARPPRAPQALAPATSGGPVFIAPPKGSAMSDPNALAHALAMTQQSLAALQRMQEQTAALHKQFLDGQEAAQRTLQTLVEQQQALLVSGIGAASGGRQPPDTSAALTHANTSGGSRPPLAGAPVAVAPPAPAILPAGVLAAALVPRAEVSVSARPPLDAPPVPAPKPAQVASPAKAPARDRVGTVLLGVVSEKTGYPVDSLDLSLSLDSDLGVDSIKRVEILSALQEKLPDAPVVKPEHLGTLHTLKDVADFLAGGAPPRAEPSVGARAPAPVEDDSEDALLRTMPVSAEQLRLIRGSGTDVAATLLGVVSEKTGYPVDSLDLSLSLDADLGVDSIKRVEILSALQEKLPDAPVVKPEHLGTLHTLKDVADFLAGGAPATTKIPLLDVNENLLTKPVTPQMEIAPAAPDAPVPDTEQLSGKAPPRLTDSAADGLKGSRGAIPKPAPRAPAETMRQPVGPFGDRVDRSILQLVDLDLTAPRARVPLAPGAEVWVVGDDDDPLTGAVAAQLKAKGFAPRAFAWAGADGAKPPAGPLAGLVLLAPVAPGPDSGLNRLAFDWLKLAAPKLRHAGRAGGAVFTTVARLDGAFGLGELAPDADPTAGGLAGLAKTALREWPEVTCKALDLSPAVTDPAAGAAAVADEVLSTGPVEIGIAANHRCVLELARTARRPNAQLINLGTRDVVLVTGGARGVTAEVAVALAETYGPTLILTGRTPAPAAEPEYLAGVTGETEMKAAIAAALGADANPRAIGDLYKKVIAQREVKRTLERAQQAGAKAAYFSVDITDERAVADMLHKVRVKHGPVTAVVHGAGVLADKRIEDLTGEQFDHVYATKVSGLRTLLDLLGNDDLKALVLFSSTTARLGRVGQLAYACANEVLNKTAQVEARRRPGARVVSINWGPWDGGMVTSGLRKLFEAEGVGVIPLLEGATFLIQELNAAGRAVEVVALAKPPARGTGGSGSGVVPKPGSGATPPPAALPVPVMSPPNPLPSADLTVAFERVVDVATHPVLRSHVLDGLAVLPVALHLEWLAHAALHGSPGLQFHGFNDLRVTAGLKVDAGEPVPVRALAGKPIKQDKVFLVPVELRGKRKDGREVVFSRAEIVLAQALPKAPPADAPPAVAPVPYDPARAYTEYLFHGPDLHGIAELVGRGPRAFVAGAYPAPPPADWFEFPLRSAWIADPLALDTAFQVMILWTQGEHNTGSLPSFVGRYRQFRKGYPADPITVVARVTRDDARFARADIDFLAPDGAVIAQMQDYECVMEASLNDSFRKNQLVAK